MQASPDEVILQQDSTLKMMALKNEINYNLDNAKSNKIYPDIGMFQKLSKYNFEVTWKELTYAVRDTRFKKKIIVNGISGSFRSGQIFAILGPSGCGKSSFLKCLSGVKRSGVTGSITVSSTRKVKLSYIAQDDHLHNTLTVREALMYASKLQNKGFTDHKANVTTVLARLNIESCADVRAKRCSGGQRKRISIALELVSRPDILILDEPTSGLDTVTTWQLINTLKALAQSSPPMAIVATIHQPSGKLFRLLDQVYFMSFDGNCIYRGPPDELVDYCAQFSLKCPSFHNPSDFALEIASKEHGLGKTMLLSAIMKIEAMDMIPHEHKLRFSRKYRTWSNFWTLTRRAFVLTTRDIWMLPMRVIAHFVFAFLTVTLWGDKAGELNGCADEFVAENTSFFESYKRRSEDLTENLSCIVFILMITWFGSIFCVLLSYPKQMHTLLKEYHNGWYSIFSFYLANVLVDAIFQITIPNLVSVPAYLWTGQLDEDWRFYHFVVICILLALTSSSMGLIVSVWLMNYPTAAVFIGTNFGFVLYLFSGFLIPFKDMPKVYQWLSNINFIQFGFRAGVVDIYGYDRCEGRALVTQSSPKPMITNQQFYQLLTTDKFDGRAVIALANDFGSQATGDHQSVVMKQQDFEDSDLYYSIAMLGVITMAYKVLTYFILFRKVKSIDS